MRRFVVLMMLVLAVSASAGQKKPKGFGTRRNRQEKRTHSPGIHLLSDGKFEEAATGFAKLVESRADDAEALYGLAAARTGLKDIPGAMECVKKAVEAGLPIERFVAGPRHFFAALLESKEFQALHAQKGSPIVHGPMAGCVTDGSVRFWVRTLAESAVKIELSASADMAAVAAAGTGRSSKGDDHTALIDVKGLKPDTVYHYRISVDGKALPRSDAYWVRTAPAVGKPAKFRVAFGGGSGYVPQNERVWTTMDKQKPLAFLTLGDNTYHDTPTRPDHQRYCYYRRQSRPEYRALVAHTAIFSIYDDHDFGTNDCVPGPEIKTPEWKIPVWRIFRENWVNPGYGGGSAAQPGCWFDWTIGDVHFIFLDGRYYRSNPRGPNPSMLGPVQKQWLFGRLKASKGKFKVICSPVPFAEGVKPGSRDPWDGFPEERKEIFDCVEKNRIGGVFLICADRHRSDVWKLKREVGYPLYEFESSRLTNQHVHGPIKGCLFSYNKKQSFGLLDFDTTKPDPEVTYRIVNIDNELIHTFTVKLSQITPK